MAWIRCAVWVSLVLSPSFGYRDLYDYQEDYVQPPQREIPIRRSDFNADDRRGYDRQTSQRNPTEPTIYERSARTTTEQTNYERRFTQQPIVYERSTTEKPIERTTERPAVSERALPFEYNVQRVQNGGRRPVDDVRRNGNTTFKIVNNLAKPRPILSHRREGAGHQEVTTKSSIRDNVVFPGPTSRTSPQVPQVTDEECLKTGICERVPNYPEDRVNEVVKQLVSASYKFNVDRLDTPEIAQRIGPHEDMLELCKSRETVLTPEAIRDANDNWHYVINQKQRPLQGFRVEICQSESSPCSDLIYVVSSSYNKTCVQKHQYRKMVVLDSATNKPVEREFRIPSCCSCAIFAVNQFGSR